MRSSFAKSLGTVCLSILLLYSGVAWALETRLKEGEASGDERTEYGETSSAGADPAFGSLAFPLNPSRHPITRIHCPVGHYQIGPMLQASLDSRLTGSGEGVLLKASPFHGQVSSRETKASFLGAIFDRFSPFLGTLSRHLFLSVLRI